ncbi:MAG: adenosylcobinamide-GDP ribazoletransferase [Leptospirales bacterium]|nr:adenosylcobinamide-GDP ribazoletransferase [Leptospirales bacterium]
MKRQIQLFFAALLYFTRIPCPVKVGHSPDQVSRAVRYFPLIGLIVGSLAAFAYFAASRVLSPATSVLLSMIASILITGAFHEDGFADFCDGFGGGWSRERILEIMRDSRIGVFGAIGVGSILALKYHLLLELNQASLIPLLISGHALSRLFPICVAFALPYAREGDQLKPTASNPNRTELAVAFVFGVAPLIYFGPSILIPVVASTLAAICLAFYIRKWIGGFTGDCMGAIQQVTEVVFYAGAVVTWKFL